MTRPVVVHRESFGPFHVAHTADGADWLCGTLLKAGGYHRRPPNVTLSIARLRELVRAIDDAPDRTTLAKLEHMIAEKYVGDYAARELLEYIIERGRTFGARPPDPFPPAA